jgi:serine/threonine protein kinase
VALQLLDIVGKYRILERIGSGAFGDAYRVEHVDTASRAVIKILHPHVDSSFDSAEREWRATMSVSSPNVVRSLERQQLPDGRTALVMESIEGVSADDLLGTVTPTDAIELTVAVASGACALHRAGIVHRDIKPSNIIVPVGVDGRPQYSRATILDLGLAKFRDDELQTVGQVVGTPTFMAPEQITTGSVTPATDVWAIAVLLYRMLYGRLSLHSRSSV